MEFVRRGGFACAVVLAMVASGACTGGSKQPADTGSGDAKTGSSTSSTTGTSSAATVTGSATNTAAASAMLDLVIVNAIGDENPERAATQQQFFQALIAAVAPKLAAADGRLALLASPTASISGVSVTGEGVDPARVKQVNFEVAPRDALLAPLVAGCDAAASDLESSHQPGTVKVCGVSVPIPPHSWTWGVEDVKGQLVGFLRPGARRIYVVVASAEAVVLTGAEVASITGQQNAGAPVKLVAVVPDGSAGACNDRNLVATNIQAAANQTGGTVYPYCQADWMPFVQAIAGAL